MLAPRRVGKTWLIKKFADDLRAQGWMAVLCDVEATRDQLGFLRHLCERIEEQEPAMEKAGGRAIQFLNQLLFGNAATKWQDALLKMDWASFAETLVRGLDARGQPTVILVDELALFTLALLRRSKQEASEFLYRLRALQQRYRNVRWLFTGSIGLDTIAKREVIGGALLDLKLFPIEPFSPPAARAFIDHLCDTGRVLRPFTLDDTAFARLAEELGWLSPYYLEHIAQVMRPSAPAGADGRRAATVQNIDDAFTSMLAPERRNYFVAWEEHIAKNFFTREAAALRRVLDCCAIQPTGERLDTLTARLGGPPIKFDRRRLHDLLTVLVADGYLAEVADAETARYRFRSGLLRRYWQRYHAE